MATLLLLLAPWLLITSGPLKLVGRPVALDDAPAPSTGPVEEVSLRVGADELALSVLLRRADVRDATAPADRHVERFPPGPEGRRALQRALRRLKGSSPDLRGLRVAVADEVPADRLVAVLDAVRADDAGPLLPAIRLETAR